MIKSAKIMKCLIADDEPLAREVIRRYIAQIPSLSLAGECSNAIQAMEIITQNEIDIIFLDIHMPGILGTDLIKILKHPPQIIITTAFQEYALQGYELDIVDYLLKPITFERFLKSITKACRQNGDGVYTNYGPDEKKEKPKEAYLYFRTERKTVKVMQDDILYVEGMGNYVKIFTDNGIVITKNSMTAVEAMLPDDSFIRTHRSFIVSKSKIKSFNNEVVEIGKVQIPIGKLFKNNVIKLLSVV